jgi:hypothetical protein
MKYVQTSGEAFSPQKKIYSTSDHEIFSLVSIFGSFLPSWIWIQPTKIKADPYGIGSTTMARTVGTVSCVSQVLCTFSRTRIRTHMVVDPEHREGTESIPTWGGHPDILIHEGGVVLPLLVSAFIVAVRLVLCIFLHLMVTVSVIFRRLDGVEV